jgi:hypothetical protein
LLAAARYRWRVSEALEPSVMGKLRSGQRTAFKYEAAVLFGLTEESPDNTVRFLLEYEF